MKKCLNCGKTYKLEKCYQKHILLCNISKEKSDNYTVQPTKKEMWFIIQKQNNLINQLVKRVEILENTVNKDIKKINVVDWLNKNIVPDIDINNWISNIIVNKEDMYLIWQRNFECGLLQIIENNICKTLTYPFKAFHHKKKELYYYENSWRKITNKIIEQIFNKIQILLIKKHLEYDKEIGTKKIEPDNIDYLINYDKMIITEYKKKNYQYKKIEQNLINIFKINLNDLIQYQFNI